MNGAEEWLPEASVAVTVTDVVPNGSTVPTDFEYVSVTGPTRSDAVTAEENEPAATL